ncbi:MAG: tryptophan synthase subunit alpha [Sinobacterium sp.]|nr:tryptophan synthase subunit alpha [Sinobacterium sp.]
MSRISSCLKDLAAKGRKALVPYFVAGDPNKALTVPMMHAMVDAGSDIIELGIAFSDPMAEGPTIQLAHERALEHNISLRDTLALVAEFRETNNTTPIVLMGYANPIEVMGYQLFAEQAQLAGVDGILVVDLPPEEAVEFQAILVAHHIDNIYLIAPTTEQNRIKKIVNLATGYLYYVSLKGVTGSGNLDIDSVREKLADIRLETDLPICVGFGIKDADSAQQISKLADGAVVGSAIVDRMAQAHSQEQAITVVTELLNDMREAMDNA